MFVRSQLNLTTLAGTSRDTIELVRTSGRGSAVPIISFTSDDISYYDHFDWPYEIDWYQQAVAPPRRGRDSLCRAHNPPGAPPSRCPNFGAEVTKNGG